MNVTILSKNQNSFYLFTKVKSVFFKVGNDTRTISHHIC